jgi:Ca2+-binding RTX toxin-like protein
MVYGDGYELADFASGGGNTLIAGAIGNNDLWGGAAIVSPTATVRANTFEFSAGLGHDVVMDFRSGEDHIDLQGFGITSFQQLSTHFQQTADGLDMVFGVDDDVLLHGVSQVAAGDFTFS